jgi:TonB-dependent receptor
MHMRCLGTGLATRLLVGVSALALVAIPGAAAAQVVTAEPDTPPVEPGVSSGTDETAPVTDESESDDIVVTGIRASLRQSMNIKRNAQGVVDAISAEDIGKFPDTNLAESLQRITGVSIDRSSGEGSRVTVRGFGPDFNLVLLNGRQMPASSLGDCCSAPASRSFDFANLAAEGVAAVEVYKSGRASLPTGGIGSVINIRTPRPLDRSGFQGSISAKAMVDHTFEDTKVTPEISGIISKTFADDTIGVLLTGSYSRRKASLAQFNAGWREGYLGSENNWGSLAFPTRIVDNVEVPDPRFPQIENRPGPTDVYQVPQNAGYDFINIDRKRINGQAVLQVRPTDTLSAIVDYTFSQNTLRSRTSSIGVWFNHDNTSSSWTDGPVAGPNFYSEQFGPITPTNGGKDLAITGAVAANRNTNHSIGGNLAWDGSGGLTLVLDAHHSTAVSKPTSPYGSNIAVGSAIFGVQEQGVDFTSDMPVISVGMYPGSEIEAANIRPAGNAFRNAYMKDRINEVSLRGGYDLDMSFIKSLDFGATYTDNKVRSAYGFIQNDTWGGTLSAEDTPDGLYDMIGLPGRLDGMGGLGSSIIPNYFDVDTEGLIELLQSELGICDAAVEQGTCISEFRVDRRIRERTFAPYLQSQHSFNLFGNPANLRLGLRYERTRVNSSGLTPVPTGTIWAAENEIALQYADETTITRLKGKYRNWLPAIDFDMSPIRDVKLRASYSHTLTRADYASLQGGLTLNSPARPNGGSTGAIGNPALLPYKSKNIDLSAEWYYGPSSYASVGYFHKNVSNFIANTNYVDSPFGLPNPSQGAAANAARAALGGGATYAQIVEYVRVNFPDLYVPPSVVGNLGSIRGAPGDPAIPFTISQTDNSDQTAKLNGWEFALQHNFWDTGFGAILNYTIVKSNKNYDNTLRYTETQFAVTGVSDSANAVLYYDKNGLQARVAYNWRDEFLSGYGFDPFYVEAYGQWDVSGSYEFREGLTAFVEGINVTSADRRGHMRANQAVFFAAPGYARYAAGLRMSFGGDRAPPPEPPSPPPPPLPPPSPATQTCADGSVILASDVCPVPPPPPPPPTPEPERG